MYEFGRILRHVVRTTPRKEWLRQLFWAMLLPAIPAVFAIANNEMTASQACIDAGSVLGIMLLAQVMRAHMLLKAQKTDRS